MKEVVSIVINNFKNDSRVLKENISLQKEGYKVKVVALHEEGLKEFDDIQNIPVHRIKLKSRNWSKHKIVQIVKYLEFLYRTIKIYKKSDILHCNDLDALPVGVIVKKFFNKNVKIVYDAHEYEINDTPNQSEKIIKIKYFLEKILIKHVDKTITVSNAISDEYVKLYSIEKPALVLNTPPYKNIEKKDIFRKSFKIEKDKRIFLYQGSLSKGRGIENLLETFKTMENKNAVIVFMGYGILESVIRKASEEHLNIYFHNAVSPDILLDYTSSADFGISTIEDSCLSYRYCLPNKMFEYLMAEVPVIVSNLPEMKRVVNLNKVGMVVKENNTKELINTIHDIIKIDKNSFQENIKSFKTKYNWEEQEKVLVKVYEGLN